LNIKFESHNINIAFVKFRLQPLTMMLRCHDHVFTTTFCQVYGN